MSAPARLRAVSDLHIVYAENRAFVQQITSPTVAGPTVRTPGRDLRPEHPGDWLIVAGDVGEVWADVEWALRLLSGRFEEVSVGYPREWRRHGPAPRPIRALMPVDDTRRQATAGR